MNKDIVHLIGFTGVISFIVPAFGWICSPEWLCYKQFFTLWFKTAIVVSILAFFVYLTTI